MRKWLKNHYFLEYVEKSLPDIPSNINCGHLAIHLQTMSFSTLVQLFMTNDAIYTFLIYFYLDEISDWRFE